MDIVGPLPHSKRGNKYILTLCDYSIRYPEAIPTELEREYSPTKHRADYIVKKLTQIFTRVGIPAEILTDQGTIFLLTLLHEIYQLLDINSNHISSYLSEIDGLVERFS